MRRCRPVSSVAFVVLTGLCTAFGPDELLYYCASSDRGYCEEASTLCLVHGSLTSNLMRPVRYYTECMYAIQDADTQLYALLHPHMQPREATSPMAVGGGGRGGRDRDSVAPKSPTRASSKAKHKREGVR